MSEYKFNIILVGCGKMGGAMLSGWSRSGLINTCTIVDPGLDKTSFSALDGITVVDDYAKAPMNADMIIFAVKPQVMKDIIPNYKAIVGDGPLVVSIAAGTPISVFTEVFGETTRVMRTMPNTPAAIGHGMTAICPNSACTDQDVKNVQKFMACLGETILIHDEDSMNDITAVSGSGPAYVFYMIEALTAAAEAQGFSHANAVKLARQTITGAAALTAQEDTPPETLRENVTSPGGTTEAGLKVLMDIETGLLPLLKKTVQAAADRSRELAE